MDPDPGSIFSLLLQSSGFLSDYGVFFLVIAILLLLSAGISASEVALFSLTRIDLEEFEEEPSSNRKRVMLLLKRPKRLIATLLIASNLANIGAIMIITYLIHGIKKDYGWDQNEFLNEYVIPLFEIVVITFILLLFGEVTPKVYASTNRKKFATVAALPVSFLVGMFYPFTWTLIKSTKFLDRRVKQSNDEATHEEIKHAIELTSEEESPEEEKEILKEIVNFSNTQVKSIMRARVDVKAVEISLPFKELLKAVNEHGYSRLPVFEENPDHIKGILYIKDLLPLLQSGEENPDWSKLVRAPYYIPESKKIQDLLEEFKEARLHIAIVVDEFGGTSGLVTLEDIIEEIFGEINDEFDDDEQVYSKLSDTEYVFDGKIALNDLFRITDVTESDFADVKGEADSLAGLLLEICGRFPKPEEVIEHAHYRFVIESVTRRRIKRIKFVILEKKTDDEENDAD